MDITSSIKAIIVLSSDGERTIAKYYDDKIDSKQFDKQLFIKTKNRKTKDEILVMDNYIIIHRFVNDLRMYVVGSRHESPLILDRVLCCLAEVVSTLLDKNVERQSMFDNLDQVILALDEICDGGIVLETDANLILQRVCLKDDIAEQSMAQAFQSATEHIKFPWIRS